MTKNTYGSTARDENENEKDEKKSSLVSPFALDQTFDYENVDSHTHRLAGLSGQLDTRIGIFSFFFFYAQTVRPECVSGTSERADAEKSARATRRQRNF